MTTVKLKESLWLPGGRPDREWRVVVPDRDRDGLEGGGAGCAAVRESACPTSITEVAEEAALRSRQTLKEEQQDFLRNNGRECESRQSSRTPPLQGCTV